MSIEPSDSESTDLGTALIQFLFISTRMIEAKREETTTNCKNYTPVLLFPFANLISTAKNSSILMGKRKRSRLMGAAFGWSDCNSFGCGRECARGFDGSIC